MATGPEAGLTETCPGREAAENGPASPVQG